MGIIQRQSIKQSLINYIATAIAAYSVIVIYPQDKEIYGLARFIIDTSLMLVPFIVLGYNSVSIKYFAYFKNDKNGHNGFLRFLTIGPLLGSSLLVVLYYIFEEQIFDIYNDKPSVFINALPYIIFLGILLAFIQLLINYTSNFKRIVVPAVYQNLIKITVPVLILLYINNKIEADYIIYGITLNYIIVLAGMISYVFYLGQLNLKSSIKRLTKKRKKEIRNFAFFSLFGSLGSILATRIDTFMIGTLLDLKSIGAFGIPAFIATTIAIPTNAIIQISGPIISDLLKKKDYVQIKSIYKKSSLNLLIIGLLVFICIISSIEDLFSLMFKSEELKDGFMIVLFVGLAKVIDMGTSVNNQIINFSKYYKFGFYAIIFMAIINITLNFILIPRYHIIGAAAATLISLTGYNLLKMIFIKVKFDIWPFSKETIKIVMIALISYFSIYYLNFDYHPIFNIIIKSILIITIYVSLVLYLNLIPNLIGQLKNIVKR